MDKPFDDTGKTGPLCYDSREEFKELLRGAVLKGFMPAVHAIGDRAVRELMSVYEEIWNSLPERPGLSFRIEHAQTVAQSDVCLFGRFPITVSLQPVHCLSDAGMIRSKLGSRYRDAYRWKSLPGNNVLTIAGSDAPIEDFNPVSGIDAFVNRTPYGESKPLNPDERIDAVSALAAYTVNPRIAVGTSGIRGLLKPGMQADIAVLSGDPTGVSAEKIIDIKSLATFCNGKPTFIR